MKSIGRKVLPAIYTLILFTVIWFTSCESKNEEDLFGEQECDTSHVSFSADVQPILNNICAACHYEPNLIAAPRNFEGYNNFIIWVNNGRVQGALNHLPGFSPMPKDRQEKLPECTLARINKWVEQGAPNN